MSDFYLLFMATDISLVDGHNWHRKSSSYAVCFLIRNIPSSDVSVVSELATCNDEFHSEQESKASILAQVNRELKSLSTESIER